MKESKNELLSVPNALSIIRILMIPIYCFFFFHANSRLDYFFCASILAISCVTDFFDGWVARKYKQITRVGKLLDPIADKATQVCLLYSLSIKYPLLLSLLLLLILKDSFQLIALIVAYRKNKALTGALISGKICTAILFLSCILLVLFHGQLNSSMIRFITYVNATAIVTAFINYFRAYYFQTKMIQDI